MSVDECRVGNAVEIAEIVEEPGPRVIYGSTADAAPVDRKQSDVADSLVRATRCDLPASDILPAEEQRDRPGELWFGYVGPWFDGTGFSKHEVHLGFVSDAL